MSFNIPQTNQGISTAVAKERLAQVGPNKFEKPKKFSVWKLVLSQFQSPLIYVLLVAAAVTALLHEYIDASVISLVVIVNATLGFWQEFKAAKSLEALQDYLKPTVQALRGGKKTEVLLSELVPGDIVFLDTGSSVPADGVLVNSEMLLVNEALLTGESRPVQKEKLNLSSFKTLTEIEGGEVHDQNSVNWVYMGTSVSAGVGTMLVVKTGSDTQMGKIAASLNQTEDEETPLQVQLARMAKTLMYLVVGITGILFPLGLYQGIHWLEMFETAVAVAVAAIPEGLAVSLTVILSIGMQRILKRKALVRKLVSAETLGSVSVICCDKTGTLTKGEMSVVDFVGDRDRLIRASVFSNDDRDQESLAMSGWAESELKKKATLWTKLRTLARLRDHFKRVDSLPFSSKVKYAVSLNTSSKAGYISFAGAPEIVLKRSNLPQTDKKAIQAQIKKLASQGYRLIGFAGKTVKPTQTKIQNSDLEKLDWYGVLAFADPLRPKVKEALDQAQTAGVKVKVITGDYLETALAVLNPVLGNLSADEYTTGPELAKMSGKILKEKILTTTLFARTSPEQKLVIVNALIEAGEVVAMTGDGVNDAPALKAADIGVVVNDATDVSKQTADMVLLNSNFKTIIMAIKEGRAIYDSIKKIVAYLLCDTFQELILIGGSLLLGLPLPVTAIQILWINLVEDSFLGVALAFEPSDDDVMTEKPRKRGAPIIDAEIKFLIGAVGLASNLILLGLYVYLLGRDFEVQRLQTFMFVSMASNSLMYIFSIKSLNKNIWEADIFNNKFLWGAVILGFFLTYIAVYMPFFQNILKTVPLSLMEVGMLLGLGLVTVTMVEIIKWGFIHLIENKE